MKHTSPTFKSSIQKLLRNVITFLHKFNYERRYSKLFLFWNMKLSNDSSTECNSNDYNVNTLCSVLSIMIFIGCFSYFFCFVFPCLITIITILKVFCFSLFFVFVFVLARSLTETLWETCILRCNFGRGGWHDKMTFAHDRSSILLSNKDTPSQRLS